MKSLLIKHMLSIPGEMAAVNEKREKPGNKFFRPTSNGTKGG